MRKPKVAAAWIISTSLSMIETSAFSAKRHWETTWPKRPKPIISTSPVRPSATSMPSREGLSSFGTRYFSPISASGVSTMEMMTMAVRVALARPSMRPALVAAA